MTTHRLVVAVLKQLASCTSSAIIEATALKLHKNTSLLLDKSNIQKEAEADLHLMMMIHKCYHIRSFNERKRGYEFWSQRLYKTDASSLCGTSTQFICTGTGDESPKLTLKVLDIT